MWTASPTYALSWATLTHAIRVRSVAQPKCIRGWSCPHSQFKKTQNCTHYWPKTTDGDLFDASSHQKVDDWRNNERKRRQMFRSGRRVAPRVQKDLVVADLTRVWNGTFVTRFHAQNWLSKIHLQPYARSHRECGQFLPCIHDNFEKFEMISTPPGSWWDQRRNRIQLPVGVEIILEFFKIFTNTGTELSTLSMGQSIGLREFLNTIPPLRVHEGCKILWNCRKFYWPMLSIAGGSITKDGPCKLDWIPGGEIHRSRLWAPRSWTRALAGARIHERGAHHGHLWCPWSWWTAPSPESSEAGIKSNPIRQPWPKKSQGYSYICFDCSCTLRGLYSGFTVMSLQLTC